MDYEKSCKNIQLLSINVVDDSLSSFVNMISYFKLILIIHRTHIRPNWIEFTATNISHLKLSRRIFRLIVSSNYTNDKHKVFQRKPLSK